MSGYGNIPKPAGEPWKTVPGTKRRRKQAAFRRSREELERKQMHQQIIQAEKGGVKKPWWKLW